MDSNSHEIPADDYVRLRKSNVFLSKYSTNFTVILDVYHIESPW